MNQALPGEAIANPAARPPPGADVHQEPRRIPVVQELIRVVLRIRPKPPQQGGRAESGRIALARRQRGCIVEGEVAEETRLSRREEL